MDREHLQALVDSLDNKTFNALSVAVVERQHREAQITARDITLTIQERVYCASGKHIEAIKSVRARYNCSLHVAKIAVDWHREEMEELATKNGYTYG